MLGRTHAIGGLTFWTLTAPLTGGPAWAQVAGAVFAVWGAYGPDMDHAKATWSQSFWGGSWVAKGVSRAVGGHRMGTHSLVSIPLAGLAMLGVLLAAQTIEPYPVSLSLQWALAFAVGWASHLFLDGLTVMGIGVFYPFSRKKYRWGLMKTSRSLKQLNPGERRVTVLMTITTALLLLNTIAGGSID